MRRYGGSRPVVIAFLILSLMLCAVFVLGQGGTGREPTNANSRKKPPTPKPTRSPAKAGTPRRSTAPANNNRKQTTGEPKADDAVANERTYWETIRLSIDPEDFKAYLVKYPKGQFAALARNSLRRLETQPKPRETNTNSAPPTAGGAKPVLKPGSIVRNQLGMELVYVPAGSFMMGSNNGPAHEKPVHQVTIKEGFYMGRYEVTQAEWKQVMGNNPSYFKGDRLPVENVTWENAESFVNALNARGEKFFHRFPTEAEWEYACRAGTTGEYAGELAEMAWLRENSGRRTHAVGGKRPNAWGLYDMHGNVWEWCSDRFHESYAGAPSDGSAWQGGNDLMRVLRGGSWVDPAQFLRSAFRLGNTSRSRTPSCGFRVVAIPPMVLGVIS